MGAALSSQSAAPPHSQTDLAWLLNYSDSTLKYASHVTLETLQFGDTKLLALAYQASESPYEGSPSQHLRFSLSKDGGHSWTASRVIMWGLGPIWSPILFWDDRTARLFLFYSESRKSYSPGGDIKCIYSSDAGETWSSPLTIYAHEADGEVPKVTASRPAVDKNGAWYLPFHTEPAESFKVFNSKTWCALKEAGDALTSIPVPPAAAPQGVVTSAGVLVSKNGGATWALGGHVEDATSWLIQPTLDLTTKGGLMMMFRTSMGKIYASISDDGAKTWTKPAPTSLPNPNSKFATLAVEGQLLLVHNASPTSLSSLVLALSVDDGRRWELLCKVDESTDDVLCNPWITEWSDDTVKVAYTVWGKGLKLATLKLATVD